MADPEIFPQRPRVAVACGCELGEAPAWDHRLGRLYWVDIKRHRLLAWRPDEGGEPHAWQLGEPITFVELTEDPALLILGTKSGVARFDTRDGSSTLVLEPEAHIPGNRLNDATVAPDGSLFFGSMDDGERDPTGSFYHWTPSGLLRFGERAVVTNGPTVDLDRGRVYTADTTARRVYMHAIEPGGGPGERELFTAFPEGWGAPDGVTVDVEGHVWICHFGGSRVTRFSPEGEAQLVIPMPTSQVTKVAFGGPGLSTLFISTAAIGQDRETDPLAGHLFAVETGSVGLRSQFCRMGMP